MCRIVNIQDEMHAGCILSRNVFSSSYHIPCLERHRITTAQFIQSFYDVITNFDCICALSAELTRGNCSSCGLFNVNRKHRIVLSFLVTDQLNAQIPVL